jgi:hypothetical protein
MLSAYDLLLIVMLKIILDLKLFEILLPSKSLYTLFRPTSRARHDLSTDLHIVTLLTDNVAI